MAIIGAAEEGKEPPGQTEGIDHFAGDGVQAHAVPPLGNWVQSKPRVHRSPELAGACQGCAAASQTLLVEQNLKDLVDERIRVIEV